MSSNPLKETINVDLARRQHRAYVSVLKEAGIHVIELQPQEQFPDSVFMQDPAVIGTRRMIVARFTAESRRGEEECLLSDMNKEWPIIEQRRSISAPGLLEGGDIMVTDRGLFVGESTRTNSNGIEQLRKAMRGIDVHTVKTNLFHLLCACSYLGAGNMMIVPELLNPNDFRRFKFIRVPKQESYACNALHVGGGKVVIPSGYAETRNRLRQAGYFPIEVDMSEFYKGDGGVTCLSSPVYKVL